MDEHTKEMLGLKPADLTLYLGFALLILAHYVGTATVDIALYCLGLICCLLACWLGMPPEQDYVGFVNFLKLASYPLFTLVFLYFADFGGWAGAAWAFTAVLVGLLLWRSLRAGQAINIESVAYGSDSIRRVFENRKAYQALKAELAKAEDYAQRYFICEALQQLYPIRAVKAWVATEQNSADAWLCYGVRLIGWAWQGRGSGMASSVSNRGWKKFYKRLALSRDALEKSAELNPADPTPWVYLIAVAMGDSDEVEERVAYFQQAVQRDPGHLGAHLRMTTALSQKWGGDNDMMVDFANEVLAQSKPGSDLPVVLLKAYYLYWEYLIYFIEDQEQAEGFLQADVVLANGVDAYQQSLDHERHREMADSVFARCVACTWFWKVQDKQRLRQELNALGDKVATIEWTAFGLMATADELKEFVQS